MTPEGLNTQQVHGQDLPDHAFMGGANGIGGFRHPQQTGVLKQASMHIFQCRQQRSAIRRTGHDHHHQPAAQDADDNLANSRLRDSPQLVGVGNVDNRKGDNGAGIAGELESVGHVVGIHCAGPGTERNPRRNAE